MNTTCAKCGAVEDFTITEKSNNQVCKCNQCGHGMGNLPQANKEPILYVGKYKGKSVNEIDDLPYLRWLLANVKLPPHIIAAINAKLL